MCIVEAKPPVPFGYIRFTALDCQLPQQSLRIREEKKQFLKKKRIFRLGKRGAAPAI
jgi:hypothetical protein